jgi:uncharacterized protein (TIGR03067 family)
LAKTSEAVAPAGAFPAGAARLTDEVLKGMMLTKLRVTAGAVLASVLVAVGVAAALPGEPAHQPEKPKASPATAKEQPTKRGAKTGAVPDREALPGLWVLEKYEQGKGVPGTPDRDVTAKMQFLITRDVWWGMMPGQKEAVAPMRVKLDPSKNPKWLDIILSPSDVNRCIYEFDGEKLRICVSGGDGAPRPAEFDTEGDSPVVVMQFRREKLPPEPGDKALVGSWENPFERLGVDEGKNLRTPIQRVEILDGYLFALPDGGVPNPTWIGGKYTVDTTKNPKWIDVELVAPLGEKVAKLYGCYEVADGRLKLALGTTGQRVLRPLELKADKDVLFFDVPATKEPLPTDRPKPDGDRLDDLMKARDFTAAEKLLRQRLPKMNGLHLADGELRLGICLLERSREVQPADATKLRVEAAKVFQEAVRRTREHEKADEPDERAARIRSQAEVRLLQLAHLQGEPELVLKAAEQLRPKHAGTVEELIILAFVYHAYQQRGGTANALATRDRMKELFGKLKDKPAAFSADSGEYSRAYWERMWFKDK